MPISHENISHVDKQANPTFPIKNSHLNTFKRQPQNKLMRQYFKLLLSDILPVRAQEFQN